jgi:hypothetical protein
MIQYAVGHLIRNALLAKKRSQRSAQIMCAHVGHTKRLRSIAPHGHRNCFSVDVPNAAIAHWIREHEL